MSQQQKEIKFIGNLYPFQREGVNFLKTMRKGYLLADEMGLGKTRQSIAFAVECNYLPAMIVCPKNVVLNWKREIEQLVTVNGKPPKISILQDRDGDYDESEFYIVSYSMLQKLSDLLPLAHAKTLILDECHYVKNRESKRTKAITKLSRIVPHVVGMSGTPVMTDDVEIFTIMGIINPECYGLKFFEFVANYCKPKSRFGGFIIKPEKVLEVHNRLMKFTLRRLKEDVLKDLPDKLVYNRIIAGDPVQYKKMLKTALKKFEEESNADVVHNHGLRLSSLQLGMIHKERQIAAHSKIENVVEFVTDTLENKEPVVLFAHHKAIIEILKEKLEEYKPVLITGDTSMEHRQQAIDDFQAGKTDLIICSITAGNAGITLTHARIVIFAELDWTPATHWQAGDRVHRIGQDKDCMIYYMVAERTMDEYIMEVIKRKTNMFKAIIEGDMEGDPLSNKTEIIRRIYDFALIGDM